MNALIRMLNVLGESGTMFIDVHCTQQSSEEEFVAHERHEYESRHYIPSHEEDKCCRYLKL